jgi:hypothetical protein
MIRQVSPRNVADLISEPGKNLYGLSQNDDLCRFRPAPSFYGFVVTIRRCYDSQNAWK